MKPLLQSVALVCLVLAARAAKTLDAVKPLAKLEPISETDHLEPQNRGERCSTCQGGININLKAPNVLAALQNIPGAEVHTQSSFESCSSDKGCAGIKVKDGKVLEKFGNVDAFRAAAAADTGNEFSYHAAGTFGNGVFEAGIPKDGPFWWMNQNSPFKAGAAGTAGAAGNGGSYEKFSKTSSSSFTSGGGALNNGGANFEASLDLGANPFLNGDFAKLGAAGFNGGAGSAQFGQESSSSFSKPGSNYQSNFESSSFSSSSKNGEVDISKNPFLNGGFKNQVSGSGFQGQAAFGASAPASASSSGQQASGSYSNSNKFSGYTGSSPSPFTASTAGSNVNLIQNSQKASEIDFDQQNQQNIDEIFQETGNVHGHDGGAHNGGELQQTCAGQGYVCVHKAQCNNGVVNTNGAGILQAKTKKQYCNTRTEICCRIEISTLQGAGGLQGSLGVGSATFSGQGAQGTQGSGLFVSTSQSGSSFGQSDSSNSVSGQRGSSFGQDAINQRGNFGQDSSRGSSFGQGSANAQGSFGQDASGQRGTFGQGSQGGFESTQTSSFESSSFGSSNRGSNNFNGQGQGANTNRFNGQGSNSFGANGQASFGSTQGANSFGSTGSANNGAVNRGVSVESSSSSFESSTRNSFGGNSNANGNTNANGNKFGNGFGVSGGANFGSTPSAFGGAKFGGTAFNNNANEVVVKGTTNTQTNFVETDSFSSGSEASGIYRPGSSGPGLKPGVPYLPPDNSNSGSSISTVSSFSTTSRPVYTTPKPTYLPPTSTAAPGYLPPVGEQSINTETRVPNPNYNEGELILDENRPGQRKPVQPTNVEVPSGCAAALKCTPIEFCTAEGVISNTTVVLTRDQESYRVPLTDCKDVESGRIGKCCRDPTYSDPWPTNLIGKWAPGVFGGNDGKYTPDSRGSPNNPRPAITARPPVTGSVLLNNFRGPKPTIPSFGPNQVTPGYPSTTLAQSSFGQKGQFEVRGQGQYTQGGQGQFTQGGQGQFTQGGQGQFTQGGQGQLAQGGQGQVAQGAQGQFGAGTQSQFSQSSFAQSQSQYGTKGQAFNQRGQGQLVNQGQGQSVSQGQGQIVSQGQGQLVSQGQGQLVSQGQGQLVNKGQGQIVTQGQGQYSQGGRGQFGVAGLGQIEIQGQGAQSQFSQTQRGQGQLISQGQGSAINQGQGQLVSQGQGQIVSQGQGQRVSQGQGFAVSQGSGFAVENDYSESVRRVFLQRYSAGGQCGVFNGQKPYGNRNDLEVDFAELPWQAMVLLQTNKSLLCGGVITRPDVVVTTASCVEGLQAKNVLIKGGEWKLGIDDEPLPFQIVQVKTILRHPYYKPGSLHNDAAILVLTENLRLAKNIYPICLPGAQETLDGFYNGAGECIVSGWGKQVLQAHLSGSILHSLNISLINPGECQAKLQQEYPHLLELYDQDSCACGQPTNPINNVCKVDTGSALACTNGDGHWTLRGIYSWDSGCQPGNQLAAFYKFDLEWYEWAIGLIESARFVQYGGGAQVSQNRFSGQIKGGQSSGIRNGQVSGVNGGFSASASASSKGFAQGQAQSQFSSSQFASGNQALNFEAKPVQNSFSATYSEKKFYQSEPKIVTYTTKPEIVTFTTKPEIFTYTTKPKIVTYTTKPQIVTYTTKPQIITYETSGSGNNPQYIAPGVTYNPGFGELVGVKHTHNAQCKCLEGKK